MKYEPIPHRNQSRQAWGFFNFGRRHRREWRARQLFVNMKPQTDVEVEAFVASLKPAAGIEINVRFARFNA